MLRSNDRLLGCYGIGMVCYGIGMVGTKESDIGMIGFIDDLFNMM